MSGAWTGRHILVTGGTGGLGPAVVSAFVARGAVVHVPATGAVATGAQALPAVDVTDERAVVALFASLPPLWASIHLVGGFTYQSVVETSFADVQRQLTINFASAFLCTREAVKTMRAAGQGGRIVNIGSRSVDADPPAMMSAYSAAKAAVMAMSRAVAAETRKDGILVNVVAPTIFDTAANRAMLPDAPHDRWQKPAQIAEAIVWLASPQNEVTTGSVLRVTGTD